MLTLAILVGEGYLCNLSVNLKLVQNRRLARISCKNQKVICKENLGNSRKVKIDIVSLCSFKHDHAVKKLNQIKVFHQIGVIISRDCLPLCFKCFFILFTVY